MDIPIPNQEGDIPVPAPLSSAAAYGGEGGGGGGCGGQGHMLSHRRQHHHHHHHDPTSHINANSPPGTAIDGPLEDQQHHHVMVGYNSKSSNGSSNKVMVRYRECMKNHAAAIGGTAMDGCGEFMPSGEEGTIEALTCSACSCHRNFHRKEVDGGGGGGGGHEHSLDPWYHHHHHSPPHLNRVGRKVIVGHPHHKNMLGSHEAAALLYPTGTLIASRAPTPHQMIMPYSVAGPLPSESDEQEDDVHQGGGGGAALVPTAARPTQMVKKRYRTKFTQEQKEKMLSFAEKVGWKIQRQEESVVQQFCQEVGVKRRVLKVWMHNNKHSLARKNLNPPPPSSINITAAATTTIINNNNNNNNSNP